MDFEVGYLGLFFACFLAATVIPFSSEAILSATIVAGYNPTYSLIIATIGNWFGGITSYYLGYLGKLKWIHKYLGISETKLKKIESYSKGKELWISAFCWVPFIGDIIAVALGLLKANFLMSSTGMLFGKFVRYLLWAYLTVEVRDNFI